MFVLLVLGPLQGWGQGPLVQVSYTADLLVVDGVLDEAAWQGAVPFDAFFQREPVEGAPASEGTVVRLLRDDKQLYIGVECFDGEPDKIVANLMRRDADLIDNDNVQIVLDTFGDRRGGFFFSTNPLGARWDMLLSGEGRSRNEAWDCVWSCRAQRHQQGWSAEMAIPFAQLRYAVGDSVVWGINVGRSIRRKNEEVFLVPPPLSYGFSGRYRTSRLARLEGLGALAATAPLELVPYLQGGAVKDRQTQEKDTQFEGEVGFDFKWGLTPSLTADFSYNTDFAQVEVDQERVNLTRFSLFFPEKRDFFLEGAGVFEFGERRGGSSSRPPTLLFYSRRVGIQEGHNLPVLFGAKVAGRVGPYELGLLNMSTDGATFFDEVEEEAYRTATGEVLVVDDPELAGATSLDTFMLETIDTVAVERTNFAVVRLRRDVLERSNIGFIVLNRDPGESADYNRAAGVDANLSLLEAALNLRGFAARTWSPDNSANQGAGHLAADYRFGVFEAELSYLDVQEDFNPEAGFVPRENMRQVRGSGRYRPLPKIDWIRRFSIGPRFTYLMDRDNSLQTRDVEFSVFAQLEAGDWIGVRYRNRFERLDEVFEISDDIDIPVGDYEFGSISVNIFGNDSRLVTGDFSLERGSFFGGTRTRFSPEVKLSFGGNLSFETDYEYNWVNLTEGDFSTHRLGNRFVCSFTPDFFVRGFVQWNSAGEILGGNFLLNYRYAPGSDFFLVFNQVWDTAGGARLSNRSVLFKMAHFLHR